MKLINRLAEVLVDTRLGSRVHYILESEEKVEGLIQDLIAHVCKYVTLKDDRAASGWKDTLEDRLEQIDLVGEFRRRSATRQLEFFNNQIKNLDKIYKSTRRKFEKERLASGLKNQLTMPELDLSLKTEIVAFYDQLVDSFFNGKSEDFLNVN